MSIFKAYDIRGTYPDQLNPELAYKLGRAFVTFMKCKSVVVGRDMRVSSDELEEALIKGITDEGADAITIGLCTTPMMYYEVAFNNYDTGIMITASHNPTQYNGFKMVGKRAVPLSGETGIMDIKALIEDNKFTDALNGKIIQKSNLIDEYVLSIIDKFELSKFKKANIAIDSGNGMGALVVEKLFSHFPFDFKHLFKELDGSFPNHEANPLKDENLKDIQKLMAEESFDIGIAFDGDADRVFLLDEQGKVVRPDILNAILSDRLLDDEKYTILYDLRSSKIVKETIEAKGGTAIKCRVGHSFIKKQMVDTNAKFAAELSGHFYLRDNYNFESPFYVILKTIELIQSTNKTLSQLADPYLKYAHTGEINFKVENKDEIINKIREKYTKGKVLDLDGISVEFDDWWFNLRKSNTEPLLRLNLEADSKELMLKKLKEVKNIIEN